MESPSSDCFKYVESNAGSTDCFIVCFPTVQTRAPTLAPSEWPTITSSPTEDSTMSMQPSERPTTTPTPAETTPALTSIVTQSVNAVVYLTSNQIDDCQPISFTSSAAIIYHILRSYKGLSTTYHRLVFGLCVTDMIASVTQALSSVLTPQEVSYFAPFAKGNNNLLDRLTRASGQTTNHTSRRDYILTMRSNRANNNKRSIMHMAMGYALTWILTWGPMLIFLFVPSHFTGFLVSGIAPLQGFFNIIVYMAPKVRNAKNSKRQKITWPQAIWKVWTSKGNRPVTRGLNRQNATRRMSISAVLRKWFKFW